MQIHIINAYRCAFQAQMKQEIEGTGNSLGVWCMKLINPDCFLGAEFIYLLQEMVQVKNNLKLLKKLIFCIVSNAYLQEYALAPGNENCFRSEHLTKWAGCWLYHFPIDSNLLDHKYPVVLAYNGINHYVSTYILDQKSKNSAILNHMKSMTANISQVSEGLAGRGATNVKLYFDQLQVQINNAIT